MPAAINLPRAQSFNGGSRSKDATQQRVNEELPGNGPMYTQVPTLLEAFKAMLK